MNDLDLLAAQPLEPGRTYVIQLLRHKTIEEMDSIRLGLEAIAERTGCDFMVFDPEMRMLHPDLDNL